MPVAVRFPVRVGVSRVEPAKKSVSPLIGAVPPQFAASETLFVVPPPFQVRFAASAGPASAASKTTAIPPVRTGFAGRWAVTKEKSWVRIGAELVELVWPGRAGQAGKAAPPGVELQLPRSPKQK